jgi:DNA-binding NarL/FixJ family response regulator
MDKIRPLIVDDNHQFGESLRSFFTEHGEIMEVGSVAGGQECLDLIERTPVDIIIMGVRMSGMDGLHTSGIIKQKYPETKIIMCMAWSQRLLHKNDQHLNADGFSSKENRSINFSRRHTPCWARNPKPNTVLS